MACESLIRTSILCLDTKVSRTKELVFLETQPTTKVKRGVGIKKYELLRR
jgi:hypothetical protein